MQVVPVGVGSTGLQLLQGVLVSVCILFHALITGIAVVPSVHSFTGIAVVPSVHSFVFALSPHRACAHSLLCDDFTRIVLRQAWPNR